MKTKAEIFRKVLSSKFEELGKEKAKYSLRAFAQHLDMDASALSAIMSGRRKIGSKLINRLGKKLKLTDQEIGLILNGEEKE